MPLRNRGRKSSEKLDQNTGAISTDSDVSDIEPPPSTPVPPKGDSDHGQNKWRKFWKRFVTTWSMIFGFFFLIWVGHIAVIFLVWALQIAVFNEIALLGANKRKEKKLHGLHWWNNYLLFCSLFFIYGMTIAEHLIEALHRTAQPALAKLLANLVHYHLLISFCLFLVAFIRFVITLRPGYYRYQFKQLGWCVCIIVLVISQSALMVSNIMDGLVWWFYPSALIITNDIWAYLFGMAFGRTPLIHLSPRKTWEGAIGGAFATLVFSIIFGIGIIKYFPHLGCPKKGFDLVYPQCGTVYMFRYRDYELPPMISDILISRGWDSLTTIRMPPFTIHGFIISLFASIVGPFGGFFASGFKRAFGLKDFGNSIPGHGGLTDRFDCQVLMAAFVFVFRKTFVRSESEELSVDAVLKMALLLTHTQQKELLAVLQRALGASSG